MRSSFHKLFSLIAISVFTGYWLLIPLLTLPHIPKQHALATTFEKPGKWLVYNWRFFASPPTFNQRMYLIVQQGSNSITDTIELVAPVTKRKQTEAPFNQEANIIDHFLRYYITIIHRNVNSISKLLSNNTQYFPKDINYLVQVHHSAKPALIALDRYCRTIIEERYANKENITYQYIIIAAGIPDHSKEILIYESRFLKY